MRRLFVHGFIEILGGRKIHPSWAVPGGVREPRSQEGRSHIQNRIPEARNTILDALGRFKRLLKDYEKEAQIFSNFPTLFMGLVTAEGLWENYDGYIRFVDSAGNIIADRLAPTRYQEFIGEAVEPWSYLKFPYYRPLGYPERSDRCRLDSGIYRVGLLARLNICMHILLRDYLSLAGDR